MNDDVTTQSHLYHMCVYWHMQIHMEGGGGGGSDKGSGTDLGASLPPR